MAGSRRICNIQALRGVAALAIVIYHLYPQLQRMGYSGPPWTTLSSGVDVFFVISGFIMGHISRLDADRTWIEFYRDRFFRIVPLYWLITAIIVAVMLGAPHLLQTEKFEPVWVVKSFLFIPAVNPGDGSVTPVLIPGWTLNYEVFFYLVFGLSLAVPRGSTFRIAVVIGLLTLLVCLSPLARGTVASFYTSDIMLEFAFGAVVAIAYPKLPTTGWGWPILGLGVVLLLAGPLAVGSPTLPRSIGYGLPAVLIVLGALMAPDLHGLLLTRLGDASYSLYLTHAVVLSATAQIWRRMEAPAPAFPLLGVGASLAVGFLVHYAMERPLALLGRRSLPHREGHLPGMPRLGKPGLTLPEAWGRCRWQQVLPVSAGRWRWPLRLRR